jgi:hypothetical protein
VPRALPHLPWCSTGTRFWHNLTPPTVSAGWFLHTAAIILSKYGVKEDKCVPYNWQSGSGACTAKCASSVPAGKFGWSNLTTIEAMQVWPGGWGGGGGRGDARLQLLLECCVPCLRVSPCISRCRANKSSPLHFFTGAHPHLRGGLDCDGCL